MQDVCILLDLYGVADPSTREKLVALARESRRKGWWKRYDDVISGSYADYIGLEATAASIRTYEAYLVPGLLQTEDYARAVGAALPWRDTSEVEEFVQVRMARQEALLRETPLQLWAILGEAAMHQRIGGSKVLYGQIHHLIEASERGNVTIQVLPYASGAHPGIDGPFVMLEYPERTDLDVVLVENMTSSLYLHEDEVERYTLVFEHLRAAALSTRESQSLLMEVAKELET